MCTEFALIGASCTLDCMDLHRADAMLARGGKKHTYSLYGLGMGI
jgi:hypothetical protein